MVEKFPSLLTSSPTSTSAPTAYIAPKLAKLHRPPRCDSCMDYSCITDKCASN